MLHDLEIVFSKFQKTCRKYYNTYRVCHLCT